MVMRELTSCRRFKSGITYDRARDFLKAMDLLKSDLSGYRYSAALLGVHSAISYSDALRIGMGGRALSSEDHRQAAQDLRTLLATRKFEKGQGVDRLEKLLRLKGRVAYASGGYGLDFSQVVQQAERFAAWAEDAGKQLSVEGWRND